jgi:hypothetical protein
MACLYLFYNVIQNIAISEDIHAINPTPPHLSAMAYKYYWQNHFEITNDALPLKHMGAQLCAPYPRVVLSEKYNRHGLVFLLQKCVDLYRAT